jgi:hypothetical protein
MFIILTSILLILYCTDLVFLFLACSALSFRNLQTSQVIMYKFVLAFTQIQYIMYSLPLHYASWQAFLFFMIHMIISVTVSRWHNYLQLRALAVMRKLNRMKSTRHEISSNVIYCTVPLINIYILKWAN